jgi:small subunit ribosomal protein S8
MSMNDLFSDFVTRVNNAIQADHTSVQVLKNKLIVEVCKKLTTLGYFSKFTVNEQLVEINLNPKLDKMIRVSRPGQRIYGSYLELPKIRGGFGTNIVSTSKGIMTNKECLANKTGGEFLMQVTSL